MTITVLHMRDTMPREMVLTLTCPGENVPRGALAQSAFADGAYEIVAELPSCDDLEQAYYLTQNIESSWSMQPADGVVVKKALHVKGGKTYGLRSSMVGDVFLLNGELFVVDSFGFAPCNQETV